MSEFEDSQTHLRVTLFGDFQYRLKGQAFCSLKSRKSEAVLLALALSGRQGLSRQNLAELLWPDLSQDRALAGLRQSLSRIRGLAKEAIIKPQQGWVALSQLHVECDWWDLQFALITRDLSNFNPPSVPLLQFYPTPSSAFEDWVVDKQRELISEVQNTLDQLIRSEDLKVTARSKACDAQLVLSTTDEPLIETILNFYRKTNQPHRYSKTRRRYIDRLDKELGLKPSVSFLTRFGDVARSAEDPVLETDVARNSSKEQPRPALPELLSQSPILSINTEFKVLNSKDDMLNLMSQMIPDGVISKLTRQTWFSIEPLDARQPSPPFLIEPSSQQAFIVSGRLSAIADKVLVTLTIRNRRDGFIVWNETFQEKRITLENGYSDLVAKLSESLLSKLVDAASENAARMSKQFHHETWVRILKARHLFWRTSEENNRAAQSLLDPIIDAEQVPLSALVTATFTRLLSVWSVWSDAPNADMKLAVRLAEKAVRLYPMDPWSHFTLATCFCALQKHELALRTVDRALQLHSSFATALGLRGHVQVFSGDTKTGRTNLLRSIELNSVDPHYGIWLNSLAVADFLDEDYESAIQWIEKATSINSYWLQNYVLLCCLFSATGKADKAQNNFEKLKKVAPGFSRDNWLYSHPFGELSVEKKFLQHLKQFGF